MQRDIFLELLSKLDENCNKILVGTEKDYRRLIPTEGSTEVYLIFLFTLRNLVRSISIQFRRRWAPG
jgi:predicted ATPase